MTTKKSKKRPIGRPSKYDSKYCDMLIEHMSEGLSFESFAGLIGTCKETIYEWTRKHPELILVANQDSNLSSNL